MKNWFWIKPWHQEWQLIQIVTFSSIVIKAKPNNPPSNWKSDKVIAMWDLKSQVKHSGSEIELPIREVAIIEYNASPFAKTFKKVKK